MTCCGANVVGGFLVLLVVAIFALLALIGLVLLVVGLVRYARGRSAKGVLPSPPPSVAWRCSSRSRSASWERSRVILACSDWTSEASGR